ncbi:ATP synthase I chain [Mariprofundus micogutta]|uniref:ATP synthase I chain n=1 Tax=Mariprofundus micogutta TaxID=1921010 RepID=A0A1L8CPL4_9PROT|nr:ATP synthase subunit I [Mariprofundus micogutta]GAV20848.1 ATP synthase I chain [Mariprofundus micogutta]
MALEESTAFATVFRIQIIAGAFGLACLVLTGQSEHFLSMLYGLILMIGNAWWLASRLEGTRDLSVEAGQRSLYAGAALRFVALIAALLVSQVFGLHLLVVALGMFVAQAAVFVAAMMKFKKESKGEGLG